jgi:hypothetical protein
MPDGVGARTLACGNRMPIPGASAACRCTDDDKRTGGAVDDEAEIEAAVLAYIAFS